MTALIPGTSAKPSRLSAVWRTELMQLFRLAAPIVATQIAWVAMLTTDTAAASSARAYGSPSCW